MSKRTVTLLVFGGLGVLLGLAWVVDLRLKNYPFFRQPLGTSSLVGGQAPPPAVNGAYVSSLPILAASMPDFADITAWINSPALTPTALRGKVVLVDFWTYSCINCIRTLPYTTTWWNKYHDRGFVLVGVHTPEFDFEKNEANVRRAITQFGIGYPVAMDNDYGTWNAYSNLYWPADYLFDAEGRLRETHFGEGDYAQTEEHIQELLREAGYQAQREVAVVQTPTELNKVGTPETYLGFARQEYLGSPEKVTPGKDQTFSVVANPQLNEFYLGGTWNIGLERAVSVSVPARIVYRFHASNANLVMGTGGAKTVRAEVRLDGEPVPTGARGQDLVEAGGKTFVDVSEDRLYSLIDARGDYATRLLDIIFLDAGVQAYAFTFG